MFIHLYSYLFLFFSLPLSLSPLECFRGTIFSDKPMWDSRVERDEPLGNKWSNDQPVSMWPLLQHSSAVHKFHQCCFNQHAIEALRLPSASVLKFRETILWPLGKSGQWFSQPRLRCFDHLFSDKPRYTMTGWWYTYPSKKYESLKNMKVNGKDYPIFIWWKITHDWNHQPNDIPRCSRFSCKTCASCCPESRDLPAAPPRPGAGWDSFRSTSAGNAPTPAAEPRWNPLEVRPPI